MHLGTGSGPGNEKAPRRGDSRLPLSRDTPLPDFSGSVLHWFLCGRRADRVRTSRANCKHLVSRTMKIGISLWTPCSGDRRLLPVCGSNSDKLTEPPLECCGKQGATPL